MFDRYLQLVVSLNDIENQGYAFHNLGKLISDSGNPEDACYFYEQSIKAAKYLGDKKLENRVKINLAISNVQKKM